MAKFKEKSLRNGKISKNYFELAKFKKIILKWQNLKKSFRNWK